MENEYGMIGALVGVTIIVVGFILVMFFKDIQKKLKEDICGSKPSGLLNKEFVLGNDSKEEISKEEKKITTTKRKSRYNKDNMLYIAYDFNILGNKSFAEVDKIIRDMLYGYRSGTVAIKTTSVVFFDIQYKNSFRDIILINKKGGSISLSTLIGNPRHYISDKDDLYNFQKVIIENNTLAFTAKHLLSLIRENKINFKKEKEI